MKKENPKLQKTQFTIQEIWQAMRGNVYKSKKHILEKISTRIKIVRNFFKNNRAHIFLCGFFLVY